MKRTLILFLFAGLTSLSAAHAAPTKVGNGDSGGDLEGAVEIESGPILEARRKAAALVESLNVPGVAGLGKLLPEIRKSTLYLAKKDVQVTDSGDQGTFHSDMTGRVYARTLAEPHASTRFFPIAGKLDANQLVALHIHEGLHRSLPESVREDEAVVSAIALAITAPEASFDSVDRVAAREIPADDRVAAVRASTSGDGALAAKSETSYPVPDSARVRRPSEFTYAYRSFRAPKEPMAYPVDSMHLIRSDLYPFGSDENPIGIGIEASLIQRPSGRALGPLGLSGKMRLWSARGFDIGAFAQASLNTLSNEELKNSPIGRDLLTLGLSMRKDLSFLSVENFLSYTGAGDAKQKIGLVEYEYEYGDVITASTHPAVLIGPFRVGGFVEMNLGDYYRVSGGAFKPYDPGRYRLVSAGPEVEFRMKNLQFGLSGRFLVDSTQDASFDSLGDLLGAGVSQGNVTASLSVIF